ncbi:hypothetical protein LGQ03_05055 [Loktanella sp. TSTF-M6]|uniref:Uncharacterized protein n=1 Tax=Loktanella gaetbuli TaxID=2881335 RepID=A0ABS8BS92_9RHOB|nr:hypothetical protein [Loktanella gaetbuli]MCB5198600.1 hypothetical protein [Loktanella gaetbuli]
MPTNFATMSEALAKLSSLATFLADMPAGVRAQVEAAVAEGEADLAALQAAVDALAVEVAAGVEGLIPSLAFEAVIDPADPNPTEINGGTFNTIADAVAASDEGVAVHLRLRSGEMHPVVSNIATGERGLYLEKVGAGANPVIAFGAYENGAGNQLYNFVPGFFSRIRAHDIDFVAPAKLNAAKGWGTPRFWNIPAGTQTQIAFRDCRLIGTGEFTFTNTGGGAVATLSALNTTFDGMVGIDFAQGTAVVGQRTTTLINGGQVAISSGAGGAVLTN